MQPLRDGVDRCPFLRDEQHLLPAGEQGRDQVGDRLALARARRATHDQTLPAQDGVDRVVLARVSVEHEELIGKRRLSGRDSVGPGPLDGVSCASSIASDRCDHS